MVNDTNSALLNSDRLTAIGTPSSQFEDPNLLGIAPRASSLISPVTSRLAALSTPADTDIEVIAANWSAQGPAPVRNGQVGNINPNNEVDGAIQRVIADPTDPNIMWIGAVNGGIWRTSNATATSPTWTPLTDKFRSLSIGAMALDPTDTDPEGDGRTIIAGMGNFSSYGEAGGVLAGLLLSTNGGTTFTQISPTELQGQNISGIAKRGSMILASANNSGVYRSTDNGANWTHISGTSGLDTGNAFDLVEDPTNNQRFYISIQGRGIFRSDNSGANWTNISNSNAALNAAILLTTITDLNDPSKTVKLENRNTKMTVSPVNGRIYVGIQRNVVLTEDGKTSYPIKPFYIGFSDNQGASWTQMDLPITRNGTKDIDINPEAREEEEEEPNSQGYVHFSLLADRTNVNTVYVGGDSARLFRGDTTQTSTNPGGRSLIDTNGDGVIDDQDLSPQWQTLFGPKTANGGGTAFLNDGSTPHADSRYMTFDRNGNLIEVDDGGIYRRTSPQNNTGDWFSINGNLQVTEQHSIAYDPRSGVIISGNQDNGTTQQTATGSQIWTLVNGNDGGDVAVSVDPNNSAQSIRYFSSQNLGGFTRQVYDTSNNLISTTQIVLRGFRIDTNGDKKIDATDGFDSVPPFVTPIAINPIDPRRLVVGSNTHVYESNDQGDNVSRVNDTNGNGVPVNERYGNHIAYGAIGNPDALYVSSGNNVYVRTIAGGSLAQTSPGGGYIKGVTLDSNNSQAAFAIDDSHVFQTINAGSKWEDITGDLFTGLNLRSGDFLRSIKFVANSALSAIIAGTNQGVFAALSSNWKDWFQLGSATLPNALVWDMDYNRDDPLPNDNVQTANVLVAGTFGRGAWLLSNITNVLNRAPRPDGGSFYDVNEGSSVMLDASGSSDPNGLALTYTWDLDGDGIFGETGLGAIRGNEVGINPTFSAAELDGPRDSKTVKLRVTNSEGSSAVDKNIQINIKNVAPKINGITLSSTVINENDTITLTGSFIDPGIPDTHTVTINWGDGTTSNIPVDQDRLNRSFQLSHQYLDDSPSGTPSDLLPITVTVTDSDGGSDQASTAIRVNNIAPVITSFTSNANFADRARINKPVNINATFTDIGTLDTHRAFVDWGDGTPTQEVNILQSRGYGTVQGSHIYAKGGAFKMKLTLLDDDTGEDDAFTRAIIIGNGGGPG